MGELTNYIILIIGKLVLFLNTKMWCSINFRFCCWFLLQEVCLKASSAILSQKHRSLFTSEVETQSQQQKFLGLHFFFTWTFAICLFKVGGKLAEGNFSKSNVTPSCLNGLLDIVNELCTSASSLVTKKSYLQCMFEQQVIQDFISKVEGMKFLVWQSVGTLHSCGNRDCLKDRVTVKKCHCSSPFVPGCSENTETKQPRLQDWGFNPLVTWGNSQSALPRTKANLFAVTKGIQQPSRDSYLHEGLQAIASLQIQW